ncbi:MAG: chemotaxis protein CheW [Alphaproteobacteria bacterium]|nr:MAG: chemotaxis protein CheW [Alphaproteobacteria bacterium]
MAEAEESVNNLSEDFLTITVGKQLFGIPVLQVQDVLRAQDVTKIPLAPPEIAGSLNLRGRIVTAVDVRRCLSMPDKEAGQNSMSVVVEHNEELFSLIIDNVGDVLRLEKADFERNPGTLDPAWRDLSTGIYQLEKSLLIIMDVSKLLENIG